MACISHIDLSDLSIVVTVRVTYCNCGISTLIFTHLKLIPNNYISRFMGVCTNDVFKMCKKYKHYMYLHTVHYVMLIQINKNNKMTLKLPIILEKENIGKSSPDFIDSVHKRYWKQKHQVFPSH